MSRVILNLCVTTAIYFYLLGVKTNNTLLLCDTLYYGFQLNVAVMQIKCILEQNKKVRYYAF